MGMVCQCLHTCPRRTLHTTCPCGLSHPMDGINPQCPISQAILIKPRRLPSPTRPIHKSHNHKGSLQRSHQMKQHGPKRKPRWDSTRKLPHQRLTMPLKRFRGPYLSSVHASSKIHYNYYCVILTFIRSFLAGWFQSYLVQNNINIVAINILLKHRIKLWVVEHAYDSRNMKAEVESWLEGHLGYVVKKNL